MFQQKASGLLSSELTYQWLGPTIFLSAGIAFLLLYSHDRTQPAALRISGAFFLTLIGFLAVMLGDGDFHPAFQVVTLASLFSGHFLLTWGVASLLGQRFPRRAFGAAVLCTVAVVAYLNLSEAPFWLRYANASGFTILVDIICATLVWRARSHRVDLFVVGVFYAQAVVTLLRIVRIQLSDLDLATHSAFRGSHFASSMQTENAIFAIVIGLALFSRYSVALVMRLNRLAETDPLTGLLNRRAFEARVPAMRAASAPLPTGLIICDIDHFKRVNDTFGHDVGDAVLKAVARSLCEGAGAGAICARLGGEEFCILLPETNAEMTRLVASRLRIAIQTQQMTNSGRKFGMTASFGCCALAPDDDLRIAMARADAAVYQAKADGRNLVRAVPAGHVDAAAGAGPEGAFGA